MLGAVSCAGKCPASLLDLIFKYVSMCLCNCESAPYHGAISPPLSCLSDCLLETGYVLGPLSCHFLMVFSTAWKLPFLAESCESPLSLQAALLDPSRMAFSQWEQRGPKSTTCQTFLAQ